MSLLLANIGQLVTMRGAAPRRGPEMSEIGVVTDAAVLCDDGLIVAVGKYNAVKRHSAASGADDLDCARRVVLPGFVDSHTHPVFVTPRLVDFEQRIAGATYEEIAARGGGIVSSIDAVRRASLTGLTQQVRLTLDRMACHGTTTVECKTGYGLSLESEIKSLQAIAAAASAWPGTVVPTLLAAHAIPPEHRADRAAYVRLVCEQIIPAAANCGDSGKPLADYVDVFCERGAFTLDETIAICRAAEAHGLGVRLHLCQLSRTEFDRFLELRPASFDHMDCVGDADLPRLARAASEVGTIVTLLPAVNYFLGLGRYPDARAFIHAGVPIALATDFNPGSAPTLNMQFVLSLACTQMRMTAEEAISAATLNGACALRLQDVKGSIEVGKHADVAIFDIHDYRELGYWFGGNLCWNALFKGTRKRRPPATTAPSTANVL